MALKSKNIRYMILSFIGIGLFSLYYLNNTYVINLFDLNFPVLIKRYYSREIYLLDKPGQIDLLGNIRLWSVFIYFIGIAILHILFIHFLYGRKTASLFLYLSLLISLLSMLFFVFYTIFPLVEDFYYLSRVLKDFVMSPVLLVMFIILFGFFKSANAAGLG